MAVSISPIATLCGRKCKVWLQMIKINCSFSAVQICKVKRTISIQLLTWVGWRKQFSGFISSFELISINSEGTQTIFSIRLTVSYPNLCVLVYKVNVYTVQEHQALCRKSEQRATIEANHHKILVNPLGIFKGLYHLFKILWPSPSGKSNDFHNLPPNCR